VVLRIRNPLICKPVAAGTGGEKRDVQRKAENKAKKNSENQADPKWPELKMTEFNMYSYTAWPKKNRKSNRQGQKTGAKKRPKKYKVKQRKIISMKIKENR